MESTSPRLDVRSRSHNIKNNRLYLFFSIERYLLVIIHERTKVCFNIREIEVTSCTYISRERKQNNELSSYSRLLQIRHSRAASNQHLL